MKPIAVIGCGVKCRALCPKHQKRGRAHFSRESFLAGTRTVPQVSGTKGRIWSHSGEPRLKGLTSPREHQGQQMPKKRRRHDGLGRLTSRSRVMYKHIFIISRNLPIDPQPFVSVSRTLLPDEALTVWPAAAQARPCLTPGFNKHQTKVTVGRLSYNYYIE